MEERRGLEKGGEEVGRWKGGRSGVGTLVCVLRAGSERG